MKAVLIEQGVLMVGGEEGEGSEEMRIMEK